MNFIFLLLAALCLVLPTEGTPGYATYYGAIGSPGCGYGNPYDWIKDGWTSAGRVDGKVMTAAVNSNAYRDGLACGACYQLSCVAANRQWGPGPGGCTGNKVVVTVTDLCPQHGNEQWCSNDHTHFDCAPDAFDAIAKERSYGYVEIDFTRVACNPTDNGSPQGVSVIVKSGSGMYWSSFALLYVGGSGAIKGMEVSDDGGGSWKPCEHNYGAHWSHNGKLNNDALSLRVTGETGETFVAYGAVRGGWYGGGNTYSTGSNFARSGGGSAGGNRVSRRRVPPNPRRKKGMHCGKGKWRNRPCKRRRRSTQRH